MCLTSLSCYAGLPVRHVVYLSYHLLDFIVTVFIKLTVNKYSQAY